MSRFVAEEPLRGRSDGRFLSAPLRNLLACCAFLILGCISDYFYVRCGQPTSEWFIWILFSALYLAILWANKNLFGPGVTGFAIWAARVFVSALLLPVYAYIILILFALFHFAIGGRL